jgi:hypothetical protein
MEELLQTISGLSNKRMADIGLLSFVALMGVSYVASLACTFLYNRFFGARATGSQVQRAFPLIGISITAIFISIQFSLPLSLGLLGALSIVRFRTPIKEPEEIGFIMLVVASSLCCATFNLVFLLILLLIAAVGLWLLRWTGTLTSDRPNQGVLIVRLPREEYRRCKDQLVASLLQAVPKGRIESICQQEHDAVISFGFNRLAQEQAIALPERLQAVSPLAQADLFYQHPIQL